MDVELTYESPLKHLGSPQVIVLNVTASVFPLIHSAWFWFSFLPVKNFQADVDNSGTIDYGEFIAAMLHLNKIVKEDHLYSAFSYFDKDGSGYITQDELQQACEQFGLGDVQLEEIIREVDQDNVSIFLPVIIFIRLQVEISLSHQHDLIFHFHVLRMGASIIVNLWQWCKTLVLARQDHK